MRSYTCWPTAPQRPATDTWAAWLPALQAGGWVLQGHDGATTYSLERSVGGQESWQRVQLGDCSQPLVQLVDIAASATSLVLAPPAPAPEKFGERDDFPYLGRPDGAVLAGSSTVDEPLDITQAGDSAPQLVGQRHWVKRHTPPASLSKLAFEAQYRPALEAAGWKVRALAVGVKPGEGVVVAQFGARGRKLWAQLGRGNDNSDSGLDMKVAVQGRTDNVGSDEHNQQLSAARTEAVRAWLAAHGIEAARLGSRCFGKTAPVADNGSEPGRPRNHRVELIREGCTP